MTERYIQRKILSTLKKQGSRSSFISKAKKKLLMQQFKIANISLKVSLLKEMEKGE